MTTDSTGASPDTGRGVWLPRVFWIVSGADILLFLASIGNLWAYPSGEFDGLLVFVLLVLLGTVGVTIGIVALIRRPAAYAIALMLVAVPLLLLALQFFKVTV